MSLSVSVHVTSEERVSLKFFEKIRTRILCSINLSLKSCYLSNNVEKYCTGRQATDDNIIGRMRFACWLNKTRIKTHTHTHYLIVIVYCFYSATMVVTFILTLYISFRALPISNAFVVHCVGLASGITYTYIVCLVNLRQ